MKKILSAILLVGMLLPTVVIPAFATDAPSVDALCEMRSLGEDFYLTAESGRLHGTSGKYFGLNTSPDSKTLVCATGSYCEGYMRDYMVGVDGVWHFEIPADLYEAVVFSIFTKSTAILNTLHSSPYYKTDRAEPYYIPDFSSDSMAVKSSLHFYGYKNIGGGNYEVYAYQNGSSNYKPVQGDILGRDYRGVVGSTRPTYSLNEARGVKYSYVQINGVVRFVFHVGENITISAAEYLGKSVNPMNDGAVIKWPASAVRSMRFSVDFDTNLLRGSDDYVDVINYTSGEIYQKMINALGNKATGDVDVLDVTIIKNGQKVAWSEDQYTLSEPLGVFQYDVYRLNSDGTVTQVQTTPRTYLDAQTGTYFAKPYYVQCINLNIKGPVTLAIVKTDREVHFSSAPPTPVVRIEVETTAPPIVTQPPVTEPPVTEPPEETTETEPVSDVVAEEETTETADETTNVVKPKKDKDDKSEKKKETNKIIGVVWIVISVSVVVLGGGAAVAYILLRRFKNKRN